MKLPIEYGSIYINYNMGDDIATTLRRVADNIVNGKIHFNGIEENADEDEMYWVKDCGDYDLKVKLPIDGKKDLTLDMDERYAICFYIRDKNFQKPY